MTTNAMHPITAADGTDLTEGVQVIYDLAHQSLDWGSGMLDNEEMTAVIQLAVTMGWQVPNLPSGSALATVARQFPDHYDIEEVEYGSGSKYATIKRKAVAP